MYRQEADQVFAQIVAGNNGKPLSPIEQRKNFAKSMNACVRRNYGGKIPSYAVIARDFSLRCPEGGSISNESIRKWMTGKTLPQSHRLSGLIEWLGTEIASALNLNAGRLNEKSTFERSKDVTPKWDVNSASLALKTVLITSDTQILQLIQNLSRRDRKIIMSILRRFQKYDDCNEK